MLRRLIFLVSDEIKLPVYEKEEISILRMDIKDMEKSRENEVLLGEDKEEGTLYICDNGSFAKKLHDDGKYVVALLTDKNKNEDFSFCSYAIQDASECEPDFFERVLRRFGKKAWNILETKRCLIRESVIEDVDAFYELYKDEEITRYMEPLYESREEEIAYLKSYIKNIYEFYGFGIWTIEEKKSRRVIGRAGVEYREGWHLPEMGFVIGKEFQRQGYAYEVCRAISDYMYENYDMDELLMFIEPENTPSILLAKKLGAVFYKGQCMGKCDAYLMKLPLSD